MQLILICVYRWGCTREKNGIQSYISSATANHDGLQIQEAGLFVDMERPYLGHHLISIINCNCCGKGVLEVKCLYRSPLKKAYQGIRMKQTSA